MSFQRPLAATTEGPPIGDQPRLRDEDYPAVFARADRSSLRAQRRFLGATGLALALMVLAAAMGVVPEPWAGWVASAAFLGALVLGALAITQHLERTWYDGRALAESAKSLTWLYVARGGELADQSTADDELKQRLRALRTELEQLDFVVPAGGAEIGERMRELRAAPLEQRRDLYMRERVGDQTAYYRRRGADHRRDASRFRWATWIAQSLGLVGAVLKATEAVEVDLLGIGAAIAVVLTAWLQTRDHVTLARAYELTAADLDAVEDDLPPAGQEGEWATFVADAETAMSREHVMWLARRARPQRALA